MEDLQRQEEERQGEREGGRVIPKIQSGSEKLLVVRSDGRRSDQGVLSRRFIMVS